MEKLVQQIHNAFYSSVLQIESYANEKLEAVDDPVIVQTEKAESLRKLGFNSAIEVVETKKLVEENNALITNKSQAENIKAIVEMYKVEFPLYKLIMYSQVVNICEKYGLYLGKSGLYVGSVPDKNLKEIVNFPKQKIVEKSLREDAKHSYPFKCHYDGRGPLCHLTPSSPNSNRTVLTEFYMCAPRGDFKKEGVMEIGKELYDQVDVKKFNIKKPKFSRPAPDPIVLMPVNVFPLKELGFLIVTAWGPEAQDKAVVNEQNN